MKRRGVVAIAIACVASPTALRADNGAHSFFLGGAATTSFVPADIDPAFPKGPALESDPRPESRARKCSRRRPVCVHAVLAATVPPDAVEQLEMAYDKVVLALRAPAPLPDAGGGSPALDVYVLDGHQPLRVIGEGTPPRASVPAFCQVGSASFEANTAVRCIAEAASFRLDAAETEGLRRGWATYLGWLALGPDQASLSLMDEAQTNPQIGLFTRDASALSGAGALWWAYLEERFGSGRPAELALSLFQLSRSDAPSGGVHWHNEPDVFDVLRNAFDNDASRFADVAIDFAIARLFLGDRADGTHAPSSDWLGRFGRVRFDWSVAYDTLPRNLASPRALEPFGSTYVWLDLAKMPKVATIAAAFTWEAPVRFKWNVVAIDEQGRELRRFDVPYLETGNRVERTLLELEGAVGLAFVGINLGGVDPEYPFDPDHEPWEPHAYELHIAAM